MTAQRRSSSPRSGEAPPSSSAVNVRHASSSRSTGAEATLESWTMQASTSSTLTSQRFTRRSSTGPYAQQAAEGRDEPPHRRSQRTSRVAEGAAALNVVSYAPPPLSTLLKAAAEQSTSDSTMINDQSSASDYYATYELKILQQPEIGAEVGLDKITLGRLPIVPAPVVQVVAKDGRGRTIDKEFPYLFCSCALRQGDGIAPVEAIVAPVESKKPPRRPPPHCPARAESAEEEEFSALIGNLVCNTQRVTNLAGELGNYFVFEDMSVRQKGTYTLEFRLGEMQRATSPKLASVVSTPFRVVEWRDYPGRPAGDILTDLSRHLADQGVPMYAPPLLHPPDVTD